MKWKTSKPKPRPSDWSERDRIIFALWPRRLSDGYTYWLEDIVVHEFYLRSKGWIRSYYKPGAWKTL